MEICRFLESLYLRHYEKTHDRKDCSRRIEFDYYQLKEKFCARELRKTNPSNPKYNRLRNKWKKTLDKAIEVVIGK